MTSKLQKAAEEMEMVSFEEVEEIASLKEQIRERIGLTAIRDKADSRIKQINDELMLAMRAADRQKVKLWDGMKMEIRNGTSPSKLEATKLLEHGVPLETIQAATTPGTPYQFVMIVKPKGE